MLILPKGPPTLDNELIFFHSCNSIPFASVAAEDQLSSRVSLFPGPTHTIRDSVQWTEGINHYTK